MAAAKNPAVRVMASALIPRRTKRVEKAAAERPLEDPSLRNPRQLKKPRGLGRAEENKSRLMRVSRSRDQVKIEGSAPDGASPATKTPSTDGLWREDCALVGAKVETERALGSKNPEVLQMVTNNLRWIFRLL
jgi:hypothetical protein